MCNIYGSFRCYCPFHISSIISFVHTSNASTKSHHHRSAHDSTNKKFYAWFFHLRWTVSISTPRNELEDRWSCHTDFINLLIANRALCERIHKRIPIAVQNTVNLPRLTMNKQIDHISIDISFEEDKNWTHKKHKFVWILFRTHIWNIVMIERDNFFVYYLNQ